MLVAYYLLVLLFLLGHPETKNFNDHYFGWSKQLIFRVSVVLRQISMVLS